MIGHTEKQTTEICVYIIGIYAAAIPKFVYISKEFFKSLLSKLILKDVLTLRFIFFPTKM